MSKASVLKELNYVFGDKKRIRAVESGRFLDLAAGTIRNKILQGSFPIPIQTVRSEKSIDAKHVRHFVKLIDLAAYLSQQELSNSPQPLRKKVGRPTKASLILAKKNQELQRIFNN
jgi:hypothetical protein